MHDQDLASLLEDVRAFDREAIWLLGDRSVEQLRQDRRTQLALLHALQTVGEAAYKTTAEQRSMLPQLPWRPMVIMRHIIVHSYAAIDLNIIVSTVREDLPALISLLDDILGDTTP